MKTYEITGENTLARPDVLVHRIRALVDMPTHGVKAGDWGGFIEGPNNLQGRAWVSGVAKVCGNASVRNDALVQDSALIYGNAQICGKAKIQGDVRVFGYARIYQNAQVFGDAQVGDAACVFGDAQVSAYTRISGTARVYGNAAVYGAAHIYGNADVSGTAVCNRGSLIYGNAQISTCAESAEYERLRIPKNVVSYLQYIQEKTIGNFYIRTGLQNNSFCVEAPHAPSQLIENLLAPTLEQANIDYYTPLGWQNETLHFRHLPRIGAYLEDRYFSRGKGAPTANEIIENIISYPAIHILPE